MTAEADLWAAVFAQAIKDACETDYVRLPSSSGSAAPTPRDVHEAWRFLTGDGEWGESREFWASLNGLNPCVVREAALQRGLSRAARVALLTGECEPAKRPYREAPRLPRAAVKARNAALVRDYVAGVPTPVLAEKYGVRPATVLTITGRANVKRSPETIRAMAREATDKQFAHLAARNAEVMERVGRGESIAAVAEAVGMTRKAVASLIERHRKRAASEALSGKAGGACLAGGGGGVEMSSFHAHSMEEQRP